jgi:hypothetical protein
MGHTLKVWPYFFYNLTIKKLYALRLKQSIARRMHKIFESNFLWLLAKHLLKHW